MRFLRFDTRSTRLSRFQTDKFALISPFWDRFIEKCIVCYKPGKNITVNKQLFSNKACCRFILYMANKPNKFGIKFWLAVDEEFKCRTPYHILAKIKPDQLHKDCLRVW